MEAGTVYCDPTVFRGRITSSVSDETKRIAKRIWSELVNGSRPETFDELVSRAFVERCPLPGIAPDFDGLRDRLDVLHQAFPDFHSEILDLIAEGDKVMAYVESSGTHKRAFLGLPPTGRHFTIHEFQVLRIVDGKMVEHWQVASLFDLFEQLGFADSSISVAY